MSEETTQEVAETTPEEVQPQSAFEEIADGLMDDPEEEVEQEQEPEIEPEVAEEPKKFKVKVDGEESEVDLDTLIAGYQYQAHNTKKAQTLAERERELAAMEGLATKLKSDADFAKHVFGYGQEQPQTEELDPIEQIKADAVKEAKAEVEKQFQAQTAAQQQAQIAAMREKVSQDPLYAQVQEKLGNYVMSLPKALQQQMYETLDKDPQAYAEMYQRARATIKPPEEKKVTPPVLVDSGQSQEVPVQTTNKNNRKKLRAEMLKTGDLSKLQEYFTMEGGLADRLL